MWKCRADSSPPSRHHSFIHSKIKKECMSWKHRSDFTVLGFYRHAAGNFSPWANSNINRDLSYINWCFFCHVLRGRVLPSKVNIWKLDPAVIPLQTRKTLERSTTFEPGSFITTSHVRSVFWPLLTLIFLNQFIVGLGSSSRPGWRTDTAVSSVVTTETDPFIIFLLILDFDLRPNRLVKWQRKEILSYTW